MGGHHVRDYVLWESLAVGHPSAVTFRLDTSVQLSRSLSNNEQSVGGRRLVRCSHRAGTLKEINKSCSARHHHKRLKDYNKACIFISALVEKACFGVSWCIRIDHCGITISQIILSAPHVTQRGKAHQCQDPPLSHLSKASAVLTRSLIFVLLRHAMRIPGVRVVVRPIHVSEWTV